MESLYGATQAIAREAHKGVGMSQTGGYSYVAQGYDKGANLGNLLSKGGDSEALWQSNSELIVFSN